MTAGESILPAERIERLILLIHDREVTLEDFYRLRSQLVISNSGERGHYLRSQIVTSSSGWSGLHGLAYLPTGLGFPTRSDG